MTIYPFPDDNHVRREWQTIHRKWDDLSFIIYRLCARCGQKGRTELTFEGHLQEYPECLMAAIHSQ